MFAPIRPTPTKAMFMGKDNQAASLQPAKLVQRPRDKLALPGEKWIVLLFLADGGERAVAGTKNGFVRQGQDFLEVVSDRVWIGDVPAAHRAGEKRIAHDRHRTCESSHDEGHAAGRMPPGETRFDLESADRKFLSLVDRLRAGRLFATRKDRSARRSPRRGDQDRPRGPDARG